MTTLPVDGDAIATARDVLHDRGSWVQLRALLVKISHFQLRPLPDTAGLRLQLPQQQTQERGLARTIGAQQGQAVAAHNAQIQPTYQRHFAVTVCEIF